MIVRLDMKQVQEIDRKADRDHDRFWSAVRDSLEHYRNDRWRVVTGDHNEYAEEILDAWFAAQEEGEDNPYMTIDDEQVQAVGDKIFDHMNYGLAYGFDDDDRDYSRRDLGLT